MASRVINDRLWGSRSLTRCSMVSWDIWTRLLLYADDAGRFVVNPAAIRRKIYPAEKRVTDEMIAQALHEFEREDMIAVWEGDLGLLAVFTNWNTFCSKQRVTPSKLENPPWEFIPRTSELSNLQNIQFPDYRDPGKPGNRDPVKPGSAMERIGSDRRGEDLGRDDPLPSLKDPIASHHGRNLDQKNGGRNGCDEMGLLKKDPLYVEFRRIFKAKKHEVTHFEIEMFKGFLKKFPRDKIESALRKAESQAFSPGLLKVILEPEG